jgi:ATP-binding cassette subfamily B protein
LVVAQRVGTIKDAEQIIVLEKWEIVWIWKHLELLKNCDVYRKIAESQLSEEELKI